MAFSGESADALLCVCVLQTANKPGFWLLLSLGVGTIHSTSFRAFRIVSHCHPSFITSFRVPNVSTVAMCLFEGLVSRVNGQTQRRRPLWTQLREVCDMLDRPCRDRTVHTSCISWERVQRL